MNELDRYLSWFRFEVEILESYHARKERLAWTATAFYIGGILAIGKTLGPVWGEIGQVGMTVLVAALAMCTMLFVHMQFQGRWWAADRTRAFRRVQSKLTSHPELLGDIDRSLPDNAPESHRLPAWPRFVLVERSLTAELCGPRRASGQRSGCSQLHAGVG